MEKLRRLYTAAMLCTVAGLCLYGLGKLFFVLAFRTGQMLFITAILSLPALAFLGIGFCLLAAGVICFIVLTSEQKKEDAVPEAE